MRRLRVLTAAPALLLLTACPALEGIDFYSDLADANGLNPCDYRLEGGTPVVPNGDPALVESTLRPECKEALEVILPFDESWTSAPAGLKNRVLEAFQILIGYPLAFPPDNKLLGAAPNAIPTQHVAIFAPDRLPDTYGPAYPASADMNQNIFNYVLNMIDVIHYAPADGGANASYGVPCLQRTLSIYDYYWSANATTNLLKNPFLRAAVVVHEAHHGDGNFHIQCPDTSDVSGFNCDPDMNGPYGLEAVYFHMLLYGGAHREENGKPILSNLDVSMIASDACRLIMNRTGAKAPLIETFLDLNGCGLTTSETVALFGLQRP